MKKSQQSMIPAHQSNTIRSPQDEAGRGRQSLSCFALLSILSGIALSGCESITPTAPNLPPPGAVSESRTGEGYFFPPPVFTEDHTSVARPIPGQNPVSRQRFADEINVARNMAGRDATFVAQAVGQGKRTFVITLIGGEADASVYTARAILAGFTSIARRAPILVELGVSDMFEASDFLALLGFERVVVSIGRDFAYAVEITVP